MKLVASPNATGALCKIIATAMVSPKELLLDLLAAPTAKPSAQKQEGWVCLVLLVVVVVVVVVVVW